MDPPYSIEISFPLIDLVKFETGLILLTLQSEIVIKVVVFGLGHYNKRKDKCTLTLETCSVFVFIVLITFYILSLIHSNLWGTVVVLIKSLFHERVSLLCTEAVKRKIG